MSEGFMKNPTLTVFQRKSQRFGLFAPIRVRLHQNIDGRVTLQFSVEFIVRLKIFQTSADGVIGIGNGMDAPP